MKRILVIDDDPAISEIITEACKLELPTEITAANCGTAGLALARAEAFDLIVLDLTMPDMSGIDVCRTLRNDNVDSPIICLSSRGESIDKILGLEVGADDYLTKPFEPRELISRMKAIWRRVGARALPQAGGELKRIGMGGIALELDSRRAFNGDQELALSRNEFDLLALFISHPGRAFSREELLTKILGYDAAEYDNSITSLISRLRGKIEPNPEKPVYLKTVRGIGYRFTTAEELASNDADAQ